MDRGVDNYFLKVSFHSLIDAAKCVTRDLKKKSLFIVVWAGKRPSGFRRFELA